MLWAKIYLLIVGTTFSFPQTFAPLVAGGAEKTHVYG